MNKHEVPGRTHKNYSSALHIFIKDLPADGHRIEFFWSVLLSFTFGSTSYRGIILITIIIKVMLFVGNNFQVRHSML
jgi:hypothetical protein